MALKPTIRLHKYLAECGIASRRKAEQLISQGDVSVDGKTITEMGFKLDPVQQKVLFRGELVVPKKTHTYILLNKPKGYVTTMSDPQGRPIVTSLLKDIEVRVFPVGRLDIDTEGALLLTDDGDLAHKILHPRHESTKTYEALVKGFVNQGNIRKLEQGIEIDGRKTWPATISKVKKQGAACRLVISIHEGRKRQIRKMFSAIGHPVINLKRIAYGKLQLGSLKSGAYRILTSEEIKKVLL
ncbi:MAG: rRNA pseudouridine synthase [Desulfofustis sp.]|nr:rRNA pseudouridine synthase [Desulfofustis sp.]MBT8355843.1 rRNA pseudouridine synthase [Desulfofustis sp.]NNK57938.1 rRNA pseudouridine synthase [Desulfofustis sp.]